MMIIHLFLSGFDNRYVLTFFIVLFHYNSIFIYNLIIENGKLISDVGGAYNAGDVIAIKATPNSGYRFVKWKGDGKAYFADADSPETTLLMTASDTTVSAVYEALLRAEMPGWLTQIEAEAFMGNTHLEYVTISEQCTSIGERAFAGCTGLYEVHIAHPNAQIADSAFKDCPNLTIYGTNGSTAQQYAQAHSIPFVAE